MNQYKPIDRKEIVAICGGMICVRTLGNNEKAWGLDKAKLKYSRRPVLYDRRKTIKILIEQGLIQCAPAYNS